jgi:hypothetical protein
MVFSCELHHIRFSRRTSLPLTFSCALFGHLKSRSEGQQFGSADELLSGIRKILEEISVDPVEAVFWERIKRLD